MVNKTQHPVFRQHLAARGLRAAVAAGLQNPRVEFHDPATGGKVVIAGAHPTAVAVRKPAAAAVVRPVKARVPIPPRGLRPSR
jgi:hypothetical protein